MKLSFTVEGAAMTKLARDLFVEGNLKGAFDLLESTGCPSQYHIQVLTGDMAIAGDTAVGDHTLHLDTEDKTTEHIGFSLDLKESIKRLERQYIKYSIEYINAQQRITYWPFMMNFYGRGYVVKHKRNVGSHTYGQKEDERIMERRVEDINNLAPLFTELYPAADMTLADFPKDEILEQIEDLDWDHPDLLMNMTNRPVTPVTYKQLHDKIVGSLVRERIEQRKVQPAEKPKKKKRVKHDKIIVPFKVLENPWEEYELYKGISSEEVKEMGKVPVNLGEGIKLIYEDNVYETVTPKKRKVTLEISSWIGTSIGAMHYYGALYISAPDIPDLSISSSQWPRAAQSLKIELRHPLEEWEVKKHPDRFEGYSVGDGVPGFYSKEEVIEYAKKFVEDYFDDNWKLEIE